MKSMMSEADASDVPEKSGCESFPVGNERVAGMIGYMKLRAGNPAVTIPVTRKAWLPRKCNHSGCLPMP